MKIVVSLILIILLIPTFSLADSFLIYPDGLDQKVFAHLKDNSTSYEYVFSKEEQNIIIKINGQISNPIKTEFSNKELKKFRQQFPKIKIEHNQKIRFHSFKPDIKDEFYSKQWGLKNDATDLTIKLSDIKDTVIKGVKDMDISYVPENAPGTKTLVAIIDSGIDLTHPDLANHIYQNKIECEAQKNYDLCLKTSTDQKICHEKWANFDGDNNGYPRDCHGYNVAAPKQDHQTIPGNNKVDDYLGHGTHVAGVIGAIKNNIGVIGVSQNALLLPVKVSGQENGNDLGTDIFAKGLLYALNTPAKVINLSFGWQLSQDSILMRELIELAHTKEVLVVAAAGNSSHDTQTYPCAYQTVICVTAYTANGEIASFANFGPSIDIAAPGEMILSTIPEHLRSYSFFNAKGYDYKSGTSMAAPYVSGALSRLISLGYDYQSSKRQLLENTEKFNSKYIRFGRLNLKKALTKHAKVQITPLSKDFMVFDYKTKKLEFNIQNQSSNKQTINIKITSPDNIELKKNIFSFNSLAPNEIIKIKTSFDYLEKLKKPNIEIKLEIATSDLTYQRDYYLSFNAINYLNTDTINNYFTKFPIINKTKINLTEYLKNSFMRVIQSHHKNYLNDYLIIKEIKGRTQFLLLKQINGEYILDTLPTVIQGVGHILSKLSKIDLDGNGDIEYVLFLYLKEKEDYKVTFLTFDQNFNNIPAADLGLDVPTSAIIPTKFLWYKEKNQYQPLWIQNSLDPNYKPPTLPWDIKEANERMNRLFRLKENRLENISLPCIPINLFVGGNLNNYKILCNKKNGFYYDYFHLNFNLLSEIQKEPLKIKNYFSFEQANAISSINSEEDFYMKKDSENIEIALIHNNKSSTYKIKPTNIVNPINNILAVIDSYLSPSFVYTDDKYVYLSQNAQKSKLLKRANNKNNDFFYTINHLAKNDDIYLLYRPLTQSLGLSMDIITVDLKLDSTNQLYRNPEYQFALSENFKEIGLEFANWGQKDTINLIDLENLSLFKLNLSKLLLD